MTLARQIIGGLLLLWAIKVIGDDSLTYEDNFWLYASGPFSLGAAVSTLFTRNEQRSSK